MILMLFLLILSPIWVALLRPMPKRRQWIGFVKPTR